MSALRNFFAIILAFVSGTAGYLTLAFTITDADNVFKCQQISLVYNTLATMMGFILFVSIIYENIDYFKEMLISFLTGILGFSFLVGNSLNDHEINNHDGTDECFEDTPITWINFGFSCLYMLIGTFFAIMWFSEFVAGCIRKKEAQHIRLRIAGVDGISSGNSTVGDIKFVNNPQMTLLTRYINFYTHLHRLLMSPKDLREQFNKTKMRMIIMMLEESIQPTYSYEEVVNYVRPMVEVDYWEFISGRMPITEEYVAKVVKITNVDNIYFDEEDYDTVSGATTPRYPNYPRIYPQLNTIETV